MSCDLILRVFNFADCKIAPKVEKASAFRTGLEFVDGNTDNSDDLTAFLGVSNCKQDYVMQLKTAKVIAISSYFSSKLFYDYTMHSLARRLFFSPNGEFLLLPSGGIEFPKPEKEKKFISDGANDATL